MLAVETQADLMLVEERWAAMLVEKAEVLVQEKQAAESMLVEKRQAEVLVEERQVVMLAEVVEERQAVMLAEVLVEERQAADLLPPYLFALMDQLEQNQLLLKQV